MSLIAAHKIQISDGSPAIYNGYDCCGTYKILDKLLALPCYGPIYNLERGMQGLVMEMMLRGFLIDPLERDKAINDVKTRLNGIKSVLDILSTALSNSPLNFGSSKEIKHLFYDILHIPRIQKRDRKTGEIKYPMDEETLEKLRLKYPQIRVLCGAILSCRDLEKQKQKLEMEVDDDWRMRTSINIAGTNEWRMSSSKSITGSGGNMQNVSESVRKMFISDHGHKLLGLDKQQAESRWVGLYCGILFDDWSYLNALESGDGHTAIARMVWENDLPWTGDPKKDREIANKPFGKFTYRHSCKILGHATNILSGPSQKTAAETGIPIPLIKEFQEKYFQAFSCIPKYFTWIANQVQTRHSLTNIFGCSRDFFDRPDSDDTIRQALAYMQAGSNANDTCLGGWRMWHYMKERIQLLTQEHDAWYLQYNEANEDEMDIVNECIRHMTVEFDLGDRKFSVPTEAKTGWNKGMRWTLKENGTPIETNPRGLDKPGAKRTPKW